MSQVSDQTANSQVLETPAEAFCPTMIYTHKGTENSRQKSFIGKSSHTNNTGNKKWTRVSNLKQP